MALYSIAFIEPNFAINFSYYENYVGPSVCPIPVFPIELFEWLFKMVYYEFWDNLISKNLLSDLFVECTPGN